MSAEVWTTHAPLTRALRRLGLPLRKEPLANGRARFWYPMRAGLLFQLLYGEGWQEVVIRLAPGWSAMQAALRCVLEDDAYWAAVQTAAALGGPLAARAFVVEAGPQVSPSMGTTPRR